MISFACIVEGDIKIGTEREREEQRVHESMCISG